MSKVAAAAKKSSKNPARKPLELVPPPTLAAAVMAPPPPSITHARTGPLPMADAERAWVRQRVMSMFESDPGGTGLLRHVVGAARLTLNALAYAVDDPEMAEGLELSRMLIVEHNRLSAALDLDSYFESHDQKEVNS